MDGLIEEVAGLADRSLLVVDDDAPLRTRLGRALETRGFEVRLAGSVAEAVTLTRERPPAFAVIDLRLDDGNGLKVVEAVKQARADARVVRAVPVALVANAVVPVAKSRPTKNKLRSNRK